MKREVVYFEKPGEVNTDTTLKLAKERSKELGIKHVIVASTTGKTGKKAIEVFRDTNINLVIVTHQAGYMRDNQILISDGLREFIERHAKLIVASDVFTAASKTFAKYGCSTFGIVADTLRLFCQGMKVCVEIAIMAADAGAVPTDEEAISIGGTVKGADTAIVIKPANLHKLFEIDIREIISMPRYKA